MAEKFNLDLTKIREDTLIISTAVHLANGEGQLPAIESHDELFRAVWEAESLLAALRKLHGRADRNWQKLAREARLADLNRRRAEAVEEVLP